MSMTETLPRPFGARLLRVAIDIVVLSLSYVVGVTVDFWIRSWREGISNNWATTVEAYLEALPILLVVAIGFFAVSGFYSRQRTYRGRHKAEAVIQACLLTFLTYGAIAYSLRAYLLFPPAIAIAVTGIVATAILLGLRIYGYLWKRVARGLLSAADPESTVVPRLGVSEMQEILVIGGAGYIGSSLVPQLLQAGHSVRVLDRFIFGRESIADFAQHPRLTVQDADFRRTDQLVIAMRRADTVIHLGGIVGDPACALDEALTIELNLAANRSIAEIARSQRVRRFVFASTCSVYGANTEVLDERSQVAPVSLYARSKLASEIVLEHLADEGFRPTILRLGTVYGLSGRARFDLVVNLLAAKAATDGVITVFGPHQWRPFVHVCDAAAAFALASQTRSSRVENRIFNIGSNDQNMTLGALGRLVAERVPGSRVVEEESVEDQRNYRVSFDRVTHELGYQTSKSVADGVDEVVEAIRSGRVIDYRRADYSNVAWLRELLDLNALDLTGDPQVALESEMDFSEDPEAVRLASDA